MKSLTVLLCIFVCLCSSTLAVELDPDKFMAIDKIEPGMKGIGKTVFEGTKIEEFQVEILDITENAIGPKGDIIWVLCSGGPLEETGLLSGMSGSPIYIDGKLVGAISYRLGPFAKQPLAGVTPIADMLRILDTRYSILDTRRLDPLSSDLASSIQHPVSSIQYPASRVMPIQMSVMMGGFHPRAVNDMAPMLKEFGMIPVQGGGTSSQAGSEEVSLEPGAVLIVEFVRGDASASVSGTVTYVQDDRILAFGHPMFGLGRTNLPIAGGRVGILESSLMSSVKHSWPAKTMGVVTYDSQYGLMGVIGKQPEFIPMKVRIKPRRDGKSPHPPFPKGEIEGDDPKGEIKGDDPEGKIRGDGSEGGITGDGSNGEEIREFNFDIAKDRMFSPVYIRTVARSIIYSEEKESGNYTMRTHSEIGLKGYPTIVKDNIFSGTDPGVVADEFSAPLYALMRNIYGKVDVESVLLEISFEDERANARIDGARIDRDRVRPGDSVEVMVFLVPYMEDTVVERFEVAVPKDIPEGRSSLRISDAKSSASWEKSRAPMKSKIADLPHLIQQIRDEESNNDIIVELFAPRAGVTIRDQELPALPLTTFSVMSSRKWTGGSGPTRGTTFLKQRIHTDYVISGSTALLLNIDRDAP